MNFYRHYIGDYARDTAHLTLAEHGAYRQMLDTVYATEDPLPTDVRTIYRMVRASSRVERDAVRAVLRQFWTLTPDGWINARTESEFERVHTKRSKARASANARWHPPEPLVGEIETDVREAAERVVALFVERCPKLPKPRALNTPRIRAIMGRTRDTFQSLEAWRDYFDKVAGTPFLAGANDRQWRPGIDWLLKPTNVAKVLENNYGDDGAEKRRRREGVERQRQAEREREKRITAAATREGVWKPNMSMAEIIDEMRRIGKLPQ